MQNDHFKENKFLVGCRRDHSGKDDYWRAPVPVQRDPGEDRDACRGRHPQDRLAVHQPLDRTEYPDGYPGEHTTLLKERYKKKLPFFAM